jgi:hypothetical protein
MLPQRSGLNAVLVLAAVSTLILWQLLYGVP